MNDVQRALDEARFPPDRTLNLRSRLPTASEAVRHAESWLRERQVSLKGEVLVITGRGNNSEGGISVVREEVVKLLASLRRRNVISEVREHTPGSFVVRLAPMSALFEAPRRRRHPQPPALASDPVSLQGLDASTRDLLRTLARRSLLGLGVQAESVTLEQEEMLRQFVALSRAIPQGPHREQALRDAIGRAIQEIDDDVS